MGATAAALARLAMREAALNSRLNLEYLSNNLY